MAFNNRGNNNKGNNKKKNNDYFSQNIQKNGDDFLRMKNSKDIDFESSKIFRDLAKGNIDIEKYGHYFLEKQFNLSLQSAAYKKAIYYYNIWNAINYYITQPHIPTDQNMMETYNTIKSKCDAYNIINNGLINLYNNGNLNELYVLIRNLSQFKYILD